MSYLVRRRVLENKKKYNLEKSGGIVIPAVKSLYWTYHSKAKMRQYGLSEARVRRVLHMPKRREVGVAEKTEACMQPASIKTMTSNPVAGEKPKESWTQEIWVMYQDVGSKRKVISAWRYPGVSKPRSEALLSMMRVELDDFVKEGEEKDAKLEAPRKKWGKSKWFRNNR